MIFTSVDFPAPFSPTSACTSPRRSVRSTPASAVAPAKRLTIPSIRRRGSVVTAAVMAGAVLSSGRDASRVWSVRFGGELCGVRLVEEAIGDEDLARDRLAAAQLL